jgi:hypothetical protein
MARRSKPTSPGSFPRPGFIPARTRRSDSTLFASVTDRK